MSFRSSRKTGLLNELGDAEFTATMAASRESHMGLSFISSRTAGLYMDKDVVDETSLYTRISTSISEEDWAVKNAVLATFFLVLIFSLFVGICCGVYCCAKHCGYQKGQP